MDQLRLSRRILMFSCYDGLKDSQPEPKSQREYTEDSKILTKRSINIDHGKKCISQPEDLPPRVARLNINSKECGYAHPIGAEHTILLALLQSIFSRNSASANSQIPR